MRLLVDAHVFDGKFQGTRTYLEGLYCRLIRHTDIEFYFAAKNTEQLQQVFGTATNIHYVRLNSNNRWKRLAWEFPQIVKKHHIDYAHYQYITPLWKFCKEIVTTHDLLFLDFPQYFTLSYSLPKHILFKRSAKRADILLTVSEYAQKSIARNFNINQHNIHITYNSILSEENAGGNVDLKEKFGLDKYILTVSRIEPRKNHLSLLRAYVDLELSARGYHLVMVGSKDLAYKSFFDYLECIDNEQKRYIHFLEVPFEDLVALYKNAALFVFPSFAEGFGIPPLEALAYGCPLLCSNATAMGEFELPEAVTFNPNNYEELIQKMESQLCAPLDLEDAKQRIMEKYNWEDIADKFYRLLKDLT